MGAVAQTPTIGNVSGLDSILQKAGWQVIAGTGVNHELTTAGGAVLNNGQETSRITVTPVISADSVRLLYANYSSNGTQYESVSQSAIYVKASVEVPSAVTVLSGKATPVYFNGSRRTLLLPGAFVISDPIPLAITAGTPICVWTWRRAVGGNIKVTNGKWLSGGTGVGSLNNGEGNQSTYDYTDSISGVVQATGFAYGPVAIGGHVASKVPCLGIIGDSILAQSVGDGGYGALGGGYVQRYCENQLAAVRVHPQTPNCAFVNVARGSETLNDFLTYFDSTIEGSTRARILMIATHWWSDMSVNDLPLGRSLAQIQGDMIALANIGTAAGKYFIQSCLTPYTNTTDACLTVTNQSTRGSGYEAIRTALNTWLRNGAFAAACNNASMIQVYDPCAVVEVNSSNTLTLNGGFWKAAGTVAVSGTVTTGGALTQITDTTMSWSQDQYRGASLLFTSGNQANTAVTVWGNSPTVLNTQAMTGSAPTTGDGYKVVTGNVSGDGIHPWSMGAAMIAADINSKIASGVLVIH
jgi:hypothetical protein